LYFLDGSGSRGGEEVDRDEKAASREVDGEEE